ncbi:hypothetical protein MHT86_09950 [Corynebacterium mastitidis]|uniref:hypothetical protein n=1 Tax=Corynebacterium mastitidis TaxID=161890 RepID=UPI00191C7752|nr:hypothetical protein [Corynebacterium mastitidis]MCH6197810.1 hypothetical protein [Corynebacterium mastitidis]
MSSSVFFVYGTLGPGRPNAHILAPYGGTWRRGSVRGALRGERDGAPRVLIWGTRIPP